LKLDASEVATGIVAWLDQAMLTRDDRIVSTYPQHGDEVRPFVCFEAAGSVSWWAPLTTQFRTERLAIKQEWCAGGLLTTWQTDPGYLADGANVYVGPDDAFVDASTNEQTTKANRAYLNEDGLEAIRAEVRRQIRRRLVAVPPTTSQT
jgi:hypothetical protein